MIGPSFFAIRPDASFVASVGTTLPDTTNLMGVRLEMARMVPSGSAAANWICPFSSCGMACAPDWICCGVTFSLF